MTELASGRLLDVVRNINGHGGPAGNYDGYMHDFLVCNYRPSKLPMHESDAGRDYKDLDECTIFEVCVRGFGDFVAGRVMEEVVNK